jgi:hypothetical protein
MRNERTLMDLTPKPRLYAGERFRSSLEADWACTLDFYRIEWKYEPEGIQLPSGEGYVPDFWLPQIGTWIEVKGDTIPRAEKAAELASVLSVTREGKGGRDWPGGQIVLLGFTYGLDRSLNWRDPLGANTWMGKCASCECWSWMRPKYLACRHCLTRFTQGSLYSTGQLGIRAADHHEWTVAR